MVGLLVAVGIATLLAIVLSVGYVVALRTSADNAA